MMLYVRFFVAMREGRHLLANAPLKNIFKNVNKILRIARFDEAKVKFPVTPKSQLRLDSFSLNHPDFDGSQFVMGRN